MNECAEPAHRLFHLRMVYCLALNGRTPRMVLKLTTNQKAEVWLNLDQTVQMTTISVEDGCPSTETIMTNGSAVDVYEKPVDIASWTKTR
jgi:hypothetical protein